MPYKRPPISKGYIHNNDGALWRKVAVAQHPKTPWPTWGRGITDLRPQKNTPMVAGRLMRHASDEAEKMIRKIPCTHKIGMCRCPYERFMYYQEQDWQPWLMCLLASTSTREAAYMLEASLIRHFETTGLNMKNNYNWTVSQDYGGEGPTHINEAHNEHWVYVGLHPAQITLDDSTAVSAPALELPAEDPTADLLDAVSYTHLTLPTKA